MRKIIQILFLFVSLQAFSQENIKTVIEDFNKDGVVDTLTSYYDGGSGFGGYYIKIVNGKTGENYSMDNWGCFCEITRLLFVIPELSKPENSAFLEVMKDNLLPKFCSEPDASLEWILAGQKSHLFLEDSQYFNMIIDPETKWNTDTFDFPDPYYISIVGDNIIDFDFYEYETPEWFNKDTDTVFLAYWTHSHRRNGQDSVKLIAESNDYSVFSTAHGVFVNKGGLNKWLFISDVYLTGAPEKLRWESIRKTAIIDKYLILEQTLAPTQICQIYLINIETGICGRLKFSFSDSKNYYSLDADNFSISGDSIVLKIEGELVTYKLADIIAELESRYLIKN